MNLYWCSSLKYGYQRRFPVAIRSSITYTIMVLVTFKLEKVCSLHQFTFLAKPCAVDVVNLL